MRIETLRTACRYTLCSMLAAGLVACGGGSSGDPSSGSGATQQQQYGRVPLIVSDASSDDWATVGVQILSIALVPQGGGSNVTVYTAPSPAPYVNLEQLDQIGEILGNVSVPVGIYTGAVITVGGNAGDVLLVTSADPESGFAGPPSTQFNTADIQIQNTEGSSGSLTAPINVNFVSPLTVTTTSSNALDLEFDLSHPAFIIAHQPPGAGTLLWAVNFTGPVRHHPIADITSLVLRHLYATVSSVASDGSSITVTKDYPTLPIVSPETEISSSQALSIDVDSTNGTLFYDLDTGTSSTITSFSNVSALAAGEYLRVAARYQEGGTLVAIRIWASSNFNNVWLSPEGHVLDVNAGSDTITVMNEAGQPVTLAINGSTQFYFRDGASVIGTGPSFLTAEDLVRGFKIHASVNPLSTASPMVAETVDIETAAYSGAISNASASSFTYTHNYVLRTQDDYMVSLGYISASTANGTDASGNPIVGFKWWNFAFPTVITDGSGAIGDFVNATTTPLAAYGITDATWADPANPNGWSAPMAILEPVPLSLATVVSPLSGDTFSVTTVSPTTTYTVNLDITSGQATLVYQVDRTNNIVTVSPIDITTSTGLSTLTSALIAGEPVRIYAVPEPDGSVQAYVLLYYTGSVMPQS